MYQRQGVNTTGCGFRYYIKDVTDTKLFFILSSIFLLRRISEFAIFLEKTEIIFTFLRFWSIAMLLNNKKQNYFMKLFESPISFRSDHLPDLPGMMRAVTPSYNLHGGWKIHLNVAPSNREYVGVWLSSNCNYGWKRGQSSGQTGKDFTIYVGSFADTLNFARLISDKIKDFLLPAVGDTLNDDITIAPNVMARYDCYDSNFHQYGFHGIPFTNDQMSNKIWGNLNTQTAMRDAHKLLISRYGDYYEGKKEKVDSFVPELRK